MPLPSRLVATASTTSARPEAKGAVCRTPPRSGLAMVDAAREAGPIQLAVAAPGSSNQTSAALHHHAALGLRGPAGPLPHFDRIQSAFGHHDLRGVRAHVGAGASSACRAMSAHGFTRGHHVAFAGTPSLHTAAHEAAHVVQQAGGVQLSGGLGAAGDRHEQHADAVADAVVRGESAEALLDRHLGGHAATQVQARPAAPVQRKLMTLGEHHDEPNLASPASLLERIVDELPAIYAQFLPALAADDEEHIFAADEKGKITLDEAKTVIIRADQSFVHQGNTLAFVVPDGIWQHALDILQSPGMALEQFDEKYITVLNLQLLPQVTDPVIAALAGMRIAERTPGATMALNTGLAYHSVVQNQGNVQEYGILGNVVLSVTPRLTPQAGRSVQRLKRWLIAQYGMWEPMQMDQRHIGTHDGNDMGVILHYHLIMPPGAQLTANDEQAILQQMRATAVI
jgi:hypothetical protein